ncbi:MAG: hypothetical protein JO000_23760 [Alphaproteobacteria bacterium]|nr:hypothetical protein [Alphaproteobacteria bacterium]
MSISRTPSTTSLSTTILAIAAAAAFATTAARAADPQVPKLDVTPTCRPLAKSDMPIDEKRCRQTESDARDQLKRDWAKYTAAERTQCTATATMGGTASYVELITCLEMLRAVANAPAKDNDMRTKPTGLQPQH